MASAFFDAHCDTAYELYRQKKNLAKNDLHLDLARMEAYDGYIQVFAAFVDKTEINCSPMNHCLALLEKMDREIAASGGKLRLIRQAEELEAVAKSRGLGAILSLEGGEALEGNLAALWMYYRLGVRLITLTWNHANQLADGITEERGGGLTAFGRKAVAAMEQMGIVIDISHLSEKGFWDVAECAKYPFVASHSCVKALCGHPRNLDDRQIQLLIQRGGGIGINFYPEFLRESGSCTVDDILRHMRYILNLGGEKTLGLGSDFDGVSVLPEGLSGVQDMGTLRAKMKAAGFSPTQIEDICFGNFYRIFHDTLGRNA